MDHLEAGLANVINGAERQRRDMLMSALKAAADAYATDPEKSADMALAAVSNYLRDEHLEAPFRFMADVVLDERRRKGRTKPLQRARAEALTAATVDALMDAGLSLEQACREVVKATAGRMKLGRATQGSQQPWEQLKNLRENIIHGKTHRNVRDVYDYHRDVARGRITPADPPAPLKTETVRQIWAAMPEDQIL